jgi:hypothetical protein
VRLDVRSCLQARVTVEHALPLVSAILLQIRTYGLGGLIVALPLLDGRVSVGSVLVKPPRPALFWIRRRRRSALPCGRPPAYLLLSCSILVLLSCISARGSIPHICFYFICIPSVHQYSLRLIEQGVKTFARRLRRLIHDDLFPNVPLINCNLPPYLSLLPLLAATNNRINCLHHVPSFR